MRFSSTLLLSQLRSARRPTSASLRFYAVSALNPYLSDSEQHPNHLKLGNFDSNFNQVSVLRLLNSTKDDPYLALSFLGQLKQHGFLLNVNVYATIVRILSSWGLDRKLDSVLVELIRNEERGFSVMDLIVTIGEETEYEKRSLLLIRVSSALVKAYVCLGMFDEAIDVLFLINRLGCVPCIKSCNFLMNRLIEFDKTNEVVVLFRSLKELGLEANEYTYAIVIKALCRKGDLEGAAKLVGETSSVFAYTTFIEGLCVNGETDTAVALIKELIDIKALTNDHLRFVYGKVVRGFCKEMNIEAAENFIVEMEEIGVGPDVYACSAIIDRHCKDLNLPKALGFLEIMLRKGLKINGVIVSSILQGYCKMGMHLEALQKFKEFRGMNIFLDKVCYNVAFDALSKLGEVEEAIELLQEMMDKGLVPDVINYTTLVGGYCLQGRVVDALDLVIEMRRNGTSPDVIMYNVLANGFAKNGHVEETLQIYEDMKAEGLKPNAVTHNVIIEGMCFAREIEEAEAFLESLKEKCPENKASLVKGYCDSGLSKLAFKLFIDLDFPLPKNVYFKLFTSLCVDGYLDKALVVLERMWAYGVEPARSMYGKMIGAFCGVRNTREAQFVFDTMVSRGHIPDRFTYTIMIHTYCRRNELKKANDLFEDMKQRGIKPDVVTYTVFLDRYLKLDPKHHETGFVQGEGEKRIASELTVAGIGLDVVFYTVLIDRQCKIDDLEYATELFRRMKKSGIEPDGVAYYALISGYCRKGNIDKAVRVFTELVCKDISLTKNSRDAIKRVILKATRFRFCD